MELRAEIVDGKRVAVIRTHERMQFKRCRRKWGWGGILRGNLGRRETSNPLWLGSGFHFALEDYHGYRYFQNPADALRAYHLAWTKTRGLVVPPDYVDLLNLGCSMLEYYVGWLAHGRNQLRTYWHNGFPQVEVNFEVELPVEQWILDRGGFDIAVYRGTLDRVVEDEHGRLWILDYKTAKQFQTGHLDTDGQISAYCWIGKVLYGKPMEGFIYQQHKKTIAHEPEWLKSNRFSYAKNQATSHTLYWQALTRVYGDVNKAPGEAQEFLNWLATQEQPDYDPFVRRDWIMRNEHAAEAEGTKILMELEDMLNPDLPLYPNPTRDCSWDCDFLSTCIMMDDGSDWEDNLSKEAQPRFSEETSWRQHLQYPSLTRQQQLLNNQRRWDSLSPQQRKEQGLVQPQPRLSQSQP
jgi:hypothetical protein